MKKIVVLSSLRSGSTFLTDNLILSMYKKYGSMPGGHHYSIANAGPTSEDSVVKNTHAVIKISWIDHLEKLAKVDNISKYDAVFLKRKDKFAQCLSMVATFSNPNIDFNYYRNQEHILKELVLQNHKVYVPKEIFFLYFWLREVFEKGAEEYKLKFKNTIEVYYEDIDQNVNNLINVFKKLDLPDHKEHEHESLPLRRNWDIWNSVINKDEVLSWAEQAFAHKDYKIDKLYYLK